MSGMPAINSQLFPLLTFQIHCVMDKVFIALFCMRIIPCSAYVWLWGSLLSHMEENNNKIHGWREHKYSKHDNKQVPKIQP